MATATLSPATLSQARQRRFRRKGAFNALPSFVHFGMMQDAREGRPHEDFNKYFRTQHGPGKHSVILYINTAESTLALGLGCGMLFG